MNRIFHPAGNLIGMRKLKPSFLQPFTTGSHQPKYWEVTWQGVMAENICLEGVLSSLDSLP